MKELINKALPVVLSLVLSLWCGPGSAAAEKRKGTTESPAIKAVTPVTSVRAGTNPEFLKRIADPEFNPELAAREPDAAKRQQAAQVLADQFCQNFSVSYALTPDPQGGCNLDITVTHNYTYAAGTTNAGLLPHGLHIIMCPGVQITSVQAGGWFTNATFGSTPGTAPWNEVWWTKPPLANYSNAIPPGVYTVRLRISGLCASTPCPVTVSELTGFAHPSALNFWSCRLISTILATQQGYSLGQPPIVPICKGKATQVVLTPAPPPTAHITWYKYVGTPCPPASCSILPLGSPWVVDEADGTSVHNTNNVDNTTCYVAVIQDGCFTSVSDIKTLETCNGPPSATIGATPNPGAPPITKIDGDLHACKKWEGTLCLDQKESICLEIVNWTKTRNGQPVPLPGGITGKGSVCIPTGPLTTTGCKTTYVFTANLKNACGPAAPKWTIVIDSDPAPGSITANPPAPLCYDRSTKLTHTTTCGKVVQWEKREETTPCSGTFGSWTKIGGSEGTSVWWTNDLQKTTEYRVIVDNGACPPINPPATYLVTVKPKLTATISANKTILCPAGSVKLTAQHSWGPPCNYSVTYRWFRNGVFTGATGPSYLPTTGGNYYVIVDGGACGKAKSNVITVCNPPKLVITGDCCVCPNKPITLTATTLWSPKNCQGNCTYAWTGPGIIGPTTNATIQVGTPGLYKVTVNCGPCQLTASYQVGACAAAAVSGCDLEIKKTISPNPLVSGQPATVNISVKNVGTSACSPGPQFGTALHDPKVAGLTFTAPPTANQPGWLCSLSGGADCGAPGVTLPPGYSVTFSIKATVTAPPGSTVTDCATVSNQNDTNPANDKSCIDVKVQ